MPAYLGTTEQGDREVSLRTPRGISYAGTQLAMSACRAEVLCMRNTGKAWEVASVRPGSSRGSYCTNTAFLGNMEEPLG